MESLLDKTNIVGNQEDLFEQVVKEYGKSIYIYILSLVKHKELAEDLYQEVLISAYTSFGYFEDVQKVKSWLYKIALNKCRDYWRKEKKSKKFWEESVYTYARDTSVELEPEETLMNKWEKEEMIDTLEELPNMYKEPLLLFYYHNQTLVEISNHTKTPLSTVKTRMKRAKDQLKPKVINKKIAYL
jgi:RNA polymerase sigma factor (sigma-70 family)